MKKIILCGIALVAGLISCTEDYTNWGTPQSNTPNEPQTFVMMVQPTASSIDFATYTEETIQLFTTNVGEGQTEGYTVTITGENVDGIQIIQADANGRVATSTLEDVVIGLYGKAPTPRTLILSVETIVNNINTAEGVISAKVKASPYSMTAKLDAPYIDENGYYLVGNVDGWTCKRVEAYHMTNNGGDVYDNPEFTVELDPVDGVTTYEIKMIPAADFNDDGTVKEWGRALSALPGVDTPAYSGKFSDKNAGGNIKFDAVNGAKKYIVKINAMETTYDVKAITYNPFIYFIGATEGWDNENLNRQRLALTDESGIYTGYLYCADPNGWGNEFKFQKVLKDWDSQVNPDMMTGGITGDFTAAGNGNFKANAGEGIYCVTLNMSNMSIHATKINYMGVTGDYCGWNEGAEMTWNATDYCYELTGVNVNANGWKFRANGPTDPNWTINLGGDINDLTQDGSNLSAVGTTIKLYPTRKTSDKIYCTVE